MARVRDIIFFLYFATHIPISLFFDFQAILPSKLYPEKLLGVTTWYTSEFKDCLLAAPPLWFNTFVYCELLVQFPYFFVAVYAFFKGARACRWIRIPNLIYSTHVATTLLPILVYLAFHENSDPKQKCAQTQEERLALIGIYSPYLIVPVMMILDALFSSAYFTPPVADSRDKKRR